MMKTIQPAESSVVASTLIPLANPVVRELPEKDTGLWTDFVTRHPEANLYHTIAWRDVVCKVFNHEPVYLFCEQDGVVRGVLPMFLVKFPLLGSKLISMPYDIGSGGALAVDEVAERALMERAVALAKECHVNYLELRCADRRPVVESLGLQRSEPVLISEMELDTEAQVWSRMEKDHRKAIRKAENRGVEVREAETLEDFADFDQVILRVFRAFGTPPYGANYFPALWQHLHASGAVRLLLAHVEQRCVGGLLLFCWGTNLVSKFAACLPEAVPLRAYVALYWRAIQLGLKSGYCRLSWGTSSRDQKGLIEFKERWGAHTRPAVLYDMPVQGKIPSIEKYYDSEGLAHRVWRWLPLSTTRLGGAVLSRWFC
jgi:Acetyltransferase (GNAT) domain